MKPKINTDKPEISQDLQDSIEDWLENSREFSESEDMPESMHDQFMDYLTAFEQAEWVTAFDLLVQGGVALPNPDDLDDINLAVKLWEVIRALAMLRMFLYNTDHLSDRELYRKLWLEVLHEEGPLMVSNGNAACHIDLVGSGSQEDNDLYLRYYADEETRYDWAKDWPDDAIPAHERLPFDRDRLLPARHQPSGILSASLPDRI